MASQNHIQISIPKQNACEVEAFDYHSLRVLWLRAAVLGANDGLVSIASLMMGVGGLRHQVKSMMLTFLAGIFASACSMAMAEFVSMLDIEILQKKREKTTAGLNRQNEQEEELRISVQAATVSALVFSLVAFLPLLAAGFVTECSVGLLVAVVAATTMTLAAFGGVMAVLGQKRVAWSCGRMLVGGWTAMAFTFGVIKVLSASGLD